MRILVIEDEVKLAQTLKAALEDEGHSVALAHDGEAGIDLCRERVYDAVILDWMLPGRDGLEVCRSIRAIDDWIPVLMLTVRNSVEDRVEGLRNGADDYLTKPFAFNELLARLEALGRRGKSVRDRVLSVADLRLDPISRAVWYGDDPLDLTAREYSLLHYLLSHPGRAVCREELLVRAWDLPIDHYGGTNLVDAHIRNLRRKLGRGAASIIRTVRGSGYCLDDGTRRAVNA
jgi:DNA-binding response OmpR family regulator